MAGRRLRSRLVFSARTAGAVGLAVVVAAFLLSGLFLRRDPMKEVLTAPERVIARSPEVGWVDAGPAAPELPRAAGPPEAAVDAAPVRALPRPSGSGTPHARPVPGFTLDPGVPALRERGLPPLLRPTPSTEWKSPRPGGPDLSRLGRPSLGSAASSAVGRGCLPTSHPLHPPQPLPSAPRADTLGTALEKISGFAPDRMEGTPFSVRRIQRAEFPLARSLRVPSRAGRASPVPSGALGSEKPPAQFLLWDEFQARVSGTVTRPAGGHGTYQTYSRLSLVRVISPGKLHLQAEVIDRDGRRVLAERGAGFETFGHWRVEAGDQVLPQGTPGTNGTRARGLLVERRSAGDRSSAAWNAGGLVGRTPLTHPNLEEGVFPRDLAAVYARVERPGAYQIHGLLYSVSDSEASAASPGVAVKEGRGAGLSGSVRSGRVTLLGQLHGARLELPGREDGPALAAGLSAGAHLGPVGAGLRVRGARGPAYEMDCHGALQSTPGRVQEGDLSFRARAGLSVNAWGGRWDNPLVSENTSAGPALARVSASGDIVGARGTWSVGRSGTAVSFSAEQRRRERSGASQQVVSTGASVSQTLRRGLKCSVRWDRARYSDRGAQDHLTGDLSMLLGRRIALSLEQRTLWQEPFGQRLETLLDVSGVRLLADRVSLSAQLALTRDQWESGGVRQSQTQGRLEADVRLSPRFTLTSRYEMHRSDLGDVHDFHLVVSHSPNPAPGQTSGPAGPVLFERQVLRGCVFEDRNADGKRQENEPGVPGVEVAVDENAGSPLTTDVEGAFRTLVLPDRHTLRLAPASVPVDYSLRGIGPVEVEVTHDRPVEVSFPLCRRVGAIRGHVVDDNTGGGLSDVKVMLGNGDFTFTDENGSFRFVALPAGEYEIRLDPDTLPFGYAPVGGAATVRVGAGESPTAPLVLHTSRPVRRMEF